MEMASAQKTAQKHGCHLAVKSIMTPRAKQSKIRNTTILLRRTNKTSKGREKERERERQIDRDRDRDRGRERGRVEGDP